MGDKLLEDRVKDKVKQSEPRQNPAQKSSRDRLPTETKCGRQSRRQSEPRQNHPGPESEWATKWETK